MKLGMTFGYWSKGFNPDVIEQAQVAEALGFDSIWTAESWGNDAFTFATWIAAHTKRVRIGTGIVHASHNDPVRTAERIATIDQLSGGRVEFGFGGGTDAEVAPLLKPEFAARRREAAAAPRLTLCQRRTPPRSPRHPPPTR